MDSTSSRLKQKIATARGIRTGSATFGGASLNDKDVQNKQEQLRKLLATPGAAEADADIQAAIAASNSSLGQNISPEVIAQYNAMRAQAAALKETHAIAPTASAVAPIVGDEKTQWIDGMEFDSVTHKLWPEDQVLPADLAPEAMLAMMNLKDDMERAMSGGDFDDDYWKQKWAEMAVTMSPAMSQVNALIAADEKSSLRDLKNVLALSEKELKLQREHERKRAKTKRNKANKRERIAAASHPAVVDDK